MGQSRASAGRSQARRTSLVRQGIVVASGRASIFGVTRGRWDNATRWWFAALVCVAVGILLPMLWRHSLVDLKVYRLGGSALLDDPSTLYSARMEGSGLPFTYPPFAGLVMVPVSLVPWSLVAALWTAASLISLALVWRLSLRYAGSRLHVAAFVAVVAGSLVLEPVRETLGFGQINLMLCALIMYDLLDVKHPRRGIWLGIAAGIKLTPLVFLGLLFVTRQWRALIHASAAFAGTVLLGFLLAPEAATEYWTSLVSDTTRIGGLAFSSNQSWNAFLIRLSGDLNGGGRLWQGLVLVSVLAGLWLARALWMRGDRLAGLSVCGLIGLLCSPVSWSHHWVWAIPLGVSLLTSTPLRRKVPLTVAWFGLFALAPIWWPPNHEDRELTWSFGEQFTGNGYLIAAIVAVLLLALGLRSRAPLAPSDHPRAPAVLDT
jgi:alpha-1,2-mannosyltransferase